MTDNEVKKQISEQMKALARTTRNAVKSKESALSYLKRLGLIDDNEKKPLLIPKAK